MRKSPKHLKGKEEFKNNSKCNTLLPYPGGILDKHQSKNEREPDKQNHLRSKIIAFIEKRTHFLQPSFTHVLTEWFKTYDQTTIKGLNWTLGFSITGEPWIYFEEAESEDERIDHEIYMFINNTHDDSDDTRFDDVYHRSKIDNKMYNRLINDYTSK